MNSISHRGHMNVFFSSLWEIICLCKSVSYEGFRALSASEAASIFMRFHMRINFAFFEKIFPQTEQLKLGVDEFSNDFPNFLYLKRLSDNGCK